MHLPSSTFVTTDLVFFTRLDFPDMQVVVVAIRANSEMIESLAVLARNRLSERRLPCDVGVAAGATYLVWGSGHPGRCSWMN